MLNEVIQIISKPSWVEIAMFAVTTLYLLATIGVFLANRKMAKAAEDQISTAMRMAELSKDVELYDKRVALIRYLVQHSVWQVCRSSDFKVEISLLFPDEETENLFNMLVNCSSKSDELNSDLNEYIRNSNQVDIDIEPFEEQIEKALENQSDKDEIERVRTLAKHYLLKREDSGAGVRDLDLFEILEKRPIRDKECNDIKEQLIRAMTTYIEGTIAPYA